MTPHLHPTATLRGGPSRSMLRTELSQEFTKL
jgi:hypothetical protein